MKVSSKKTMLTAAVLVTLSSGTALAATPGTVDSQELFRSDRLVTDQVKNPTMEETSSGDRYEASISNARNTQSPSEQTQDAPSTQSAPPVTRLRWENVDARIAERNAQPSFTLAAQKAKPVIITAADVKREEKLAAKEGREPQELVGDVNMQRGPMPPRKPKETATEIPVQPPVRSTPPAPPTVETAAPPAERQMPYVPPQQTSTVEQVRPAEAAPAAEQRPNRPRYPQLPHEEFSLNAPADTAAEPKQPERFNPLDGQHLSQPAIRDVAPVSSHTIRPEGVPAYSASERAYSADRLDGISDEVRRHILAGQLAMEVQLQRDPSIAGMRAITKVLRENTTLTRLQKIDFLIGFGRALHQSGLPRQQEALLIKTIADAF